MDFDEYEYLEQAVEKAAVTSEKECNGDGAKTDERDSSRSKRRTDEDGHRSEHRSKRSRGDDEDRSRDDRERSHRSSSQHRSRDKDRDRDKDRSSRYDRDKDREKSRTERERSDREREPREKKSKELDVDKEKEKDKEKDKEKEKEKDKERDWRAKSRDPERSREKERGEKEKSKERELPKDGHREFRRSRERRDKKEDAPAEAEADPERDQRTVFAWQISLKADEKDVYDFFSKAGKVRDVRLIMDRNSRRSKGVGYVEFYDAMSVPVAIAMSGQALRGQAVMVKPSEAEKNLTHAATSGAAAGGGYNGPYSGGARRLYVGNLHVNITEEQLRQVFEPFGPVELVQLPPDPETGLCKGFGFVQYQRLEDARIAQSELNGVLELAGRAIKVSAVSDQQIGGQEMGVTQGDLDDDDGGGLALNARARALLMQKLDRSGAGAIGGGTTSTSTTTSSMPMYPPGMPFPAAAAASVVVASSEPVGSPSECLLLKNMFDPATENDPEFDLDIKEDVQEECSKFGLVKHIHVDKHSAGHVYLRFESVGASLSAQQALNNRWFAGKTISATFMTIPAYEGKFPESRK